MPDVRRIQVLVVGQTPPPFHGQAMMIQRLVSARFRRIEVSHVRMAFSRRMAEIGSFSLWKVVHLLAVVRQATKKKRRKQYDILYYVPAGGAWIPILRDVILLPWLRRGVPRLVYHFRAAGLAEYLNRLPAWLRHAATLAYGRPDASILLSAHNPNDGAPLGALRTYIVPNGIEDVASDRWDSMYREATSNLHILYGGLICREKGVWAVMRNVAAIRERYPSVRIDLFGEFANARSRTEYDELIRSQALEEVVSYHGYASGEKKWKLFERAHVFCFLTGYPKETFGNVVIEAMMWGLPSIATAWRGVQDLVEEGATGYLVEPGNDALIQDRMIRLLESRPLRRAMGRNARERFERCYSLSRHLNSLEQVFSDVAT